jgi:hypothetical protein
MCHDVLNNKDPYLISTCKFPCEVLFLSAPHPDSGQTIALIGAFYGRADRTTCIYGRPDRKFNKIDCFTRTANRVVAERY